MFKNSLLVTGEKTYCHPSINFFSGEEIENVLKPVEWKNQTLRFNKEGGCYHRTTNLIKRYGFWGSAKIEIREAENREGDERSVFFLEIIGSNMISGLYTYYFKLRKALRKGGERQKALESIV